MLPRLAWGTLLLLLGLGAGGCSYQLGSLIGKDDDSTRLAASRVVKDGGAGELGEAAADQDVTGSLPSPKSIPNSDSSPGRSGSTPGGSDFAVARAAIAEALGRSAKSGSASWETPATGARGTVTQLHRTGGGQSGHGCRDFLASHVQNGHETWLEGVGCRVENGRWEIRSLRPWKQA